MQVSHQARNTEYIRQMDYNQDYVRNSTQMMGSNQRIQLNRDYKSPPRASYQSRYPASHAMQINNGVNVKVSPPKYNGNNPSPNKYKLSPNKYNPMNNTRNRNLTVDVNHNLNSSYQNYPSNYNTNSYSSNNNIPYNNNGYVSPTNKSFIPSPYTTPNYQQPTNYTSSKNIMSSPQFGHLFSQTINNRSIIQLQKLVSELKISLQQSLSCQSQLQQQLHKQKSRTFELNQMKRKLEQELSKMEFQLDRINSSDILGQRQMMVKYEQQVLQNQRLNNQLKDVMQELKRIKNQCRQLMSQNTKYRQENQIMKNHNSELLMQIDQISKQITNVKLDYNQSLLREKNLQQNNQSMVLNPSTNINNINTTRTNNYESQQNSLHTQNNQINNSNSPIQQRFRNNEINKIPSQTHLINSTVSLQSQNYPNIQNHMMVPQNQYHQQTHQINYDIQNEKLVQDYNKLIMQNESMKKLYKQFYQQSPRKYQQFNSPNSYQKSISQHSQQYQSTHPNFYPNHDNNQDHQNQKLKTYQKNKLYQQISFLRQQVIHQLMNKYFVQSLNEAQSKKINVLVIFIKFITKDLSIIQKMVINYLQARDILKKQLNVKRLTEGQQSQPTTQYEVQAQNMYQTVKQKLKSQIKINKNSKPNFNNNSNQSQILTLNINAYFLALFRLLTLIQKYQNKSIQSDSKTLSKIKHSALKYVHKIHQQSNILKHNPKKQTLISKSHLDKVSFKK